MKSKPWLYLWLIATLSIISNNSLLAATSKSSGPRPGEENPIQNPERLTLFSDDEVFIAASANISSNRVDIELETVQGDMSQWNTGITQDNEGICNFPNRVIAAGRITSPFQEQIVCATNYGVTLLNGENPQTYLFSDAGFYMTRPVSLAIGFLDRLADPTDDMLYPKIVVSYQNLSGNARIVVLDHNFNLVASEELVKITDSIKDVALTTGDIDGNGHEEIIAAWTEVNDNAYDPNEFGRYTSQLYLQTWHLEYDEQKQGQLIPGGENPELYTKQGAHFSTGVKAADLNGDGIDSIILWYYNLTSNSPLRLEIYQSDATFQLTRILSAEAGIPVLKSYADLDTGLLKHDPQQGYNINRHQMVLSFVAQDGNTATLSSWETNKELTQLSKRNQITLTTTASIGRGPGVAVGGYIGLFDTENPTAQITVNVPMPTGNANDSYPRFYAVQANNNLQLTVTKEESWSQYAADGNFWTQNITAWDKEGDSLYLGAPIHIVVPQLLKAKYIIMEPPKHVDYLPDDPANFDGDRSIVNVSAYPDFYVELVDMNQQTLENVARDTTSWNIGGGSSFSSESTVSGGFGDLGSGSISSKFETAIEYDYNENTSTSNSEYQEITVTEQERTVIDDQVRGDVQLIDIWRYPVFGLSLEDSTDYGFYELILPGAKEVVSGGGLAMSWYNPNHQNRNVLSYPQISDPNWPTDVGPFTPAEGEELKIPLNEGVIRYWDGNPQLYSIEWSETSGSEQSKSYSSTLKESADFSTGITAKVDLWIASAENETSFDFNFHNSNSWESSSLSRQTLQSSSGITLNESDDGVPTQSYAFKTLVYVTPNGYLKVNHAVDLTMSASGAPWWHQYYGQLPDLAVNLPNRFTYVVPPDEPRGHWEFTLDGLGKQMRGLSLRKTELNPVTNTYDYYDRSALNSDDGVKIWAKLYNFSLTQPAIGPFEVLFEYQEVDISTDKPIGTRVAIGTIQQRDMGALEIRDVSIDWDISQLGGQQQGEAKYYRLYVTVDPNNGVPGELHEWPIISERDEAISNNEGYWPWFGGVAVFNRQTTTVATARMSRAIAVPEKDSDISLHEASLSIENLAGKLLNTQAKVKKALHGYRLRAHVIASQPSYANYHVQFYEGDSKLIASQVVHGLQKGDNYVWTHWKPSNHEAKKLRVVILEQPEDTIRGNNFDELAVSFKER